MLSLESNNRQGLPVASRLRYQRRRCRCPDSQLINLLAWPVLVPLLTSSSSVVLSSSSLEPGGFSIYGAFNNVTTIILVIWLTVHSYVDSAADIKTNPNLNLGTTAAAVYGTVQLALQ